MAYIVMAYIVMASTTQIVVNKKINTKYRTGTMLFAEETFTGATMSVLTPLVFQTFGTYSMVDHTRACACLRACMRVLLQRAAIIWGNSTTGS